MRIKPKQSATPEAVGPASSSAADHHDCQQSFCRRVNTRRSEREGEASLFCTHVPQLWRPNALAAIQRVKHSGSAVRFVGKLKSHCRRCFCLRHHLERKGGRAMAPLNFCFLCFPLLLLREGYLLLMR